MSGLTINNLPLATQLVGNELIPIWQNNGTKQTTIGKIQPWVMPLGLVNDGVTDNTTALQTALTVGGNVLIPPGNYAFATTLTVPNGTTLMGVDRTTSILTYTGTGDGLLNQNPINGSGYGRVTIRDLSILATNGSNAGAGIDIQAGGFAYYEIDRVRVSGFKYAVVLDQAEVSHVHHSILETAVTTSNSACVWITNGSEWRGTGSAGYTNLITINDNELNGGVWNLLDDGGNCHTIRDNNMNAPNPQSACHIAAVQSLVFIGNSLEGSTQHSAVSCITLTNVAAVGGATKGPCTNGELRGNTFAVAMSAGGGSCITFAGDFHTGMSVENNYFENLDGRGAAIDVTKLRNSFCGNNYDHGSSSMAHYTGQHRDASGNILYPPNENSSVTDAGNPYEFGDSSRPVVFYGGVGFQSAGYVVDTTAGGGFGVTQGTLVKNYAGTSTVTLPAAATFPGRILNIITWQNETVNSAANNVSVLGGSAQNGILSNTAGKWATLQSDGTVWNIIANN